MAAALNCMDAIAQEAGEVLGMGEMGGVEGECGCGGGLVLS